MSKATGLQIQALHKMVRSGSIHQKNWRQILTARSAAPGLTIWDFLIPILTDVGLEHLVPDLTNQTPGEVPASPATPA